MSRDGLSKEVCLSCITLSTYYAKYKTNNIRSILKKPDLSSKDPILIFKSIRIANQYYKCDGMTSNHGRLLGAFSDVEEQFHSDRRRVLIAMGSFLYCYKAFLSLSDEEKRNTRIKNINYITQHKEGEFTVDSAGLGSVIHSRLQAMLSTVNLTAYAQDEHHHYLDDTMLLDFYGDVITCGWLPQGRATDFIQNVWMSMYCITLYKLSFSYCQILKHCINTLSERHVLETTTGYMIFLKLPQFVESVRVFALLSVTLSDNFSEHYYSCETSSFEFERDCGPFKKGEHCILIHCQLKKDSKATADDISNELKDYFGSLLDIREVECHSHRISLEQAVRKLRPTCHVARGPHVFNDDSQPRVPANTSSDDDAAAATTTTTSTATTCASK